MSKRNGGDGRTYENTYEVPTVVVTLRDGENSHKWVPLALSHHEEGHHKARPSEGDVIPSQAQADADGHIDAQANVPEGRGSQAQSPHMSLSARPLASTKNGGPKIVCQKSRKVLLKPWKPSISNSVKRALDTAGHALVARVGDEI